MKLIDKDKVVAEIEKRYKYWREKEHNSHSIESEIRMSECQHLMLLFNAFEGKNVDLDESARHYLLHEHISPLNEVLHQADLKVEMQYHKDIEDAYKAGFELGLKAKDVNEIIKTAEDHAYFAGSENTREKIIDKACEWLRKGGSGWYLTSEFGENEIDFVKLAEDFRKTIEE